MIMDGSGHHPDRHMGQGEVDWRPLADFRIVRNNFNKLKMVKIDEISYQIKGLISEYSFGRVYNAKEKLYNSGLPDNKVKIKVINNAPADSERHKRAQKEIKYLKDLQDSENFVTQDILVVSGLNK